MLDMSGYAEAVVKPSDKKSPFLNDKYCQGSLDTIHVQFNTLASAGGYFENRAKLWQGSYLSEDNAFHLAIDVNLRAGTKMTVRYESVVEDVKTHSWKVGGWGTVAIMRLKKPVGPITRYLYGHMSPRGIAAPGTVLKPGDVVGVLGTKKENGGWFEHVHVQALSDYGWERSGHCNIEDEKQFDGYGYDNDDMRRAYPNPMKLIATPVGRALKLKL